MPEEARLGIPASLLDYLFMLIINILLAKIYLQVLFPSVTAWIFVTLLVSTMTLFNLRGIRLVAHFNGVDCDPAGRDYPVFPGTGCPRGDVGGRWRHVAEYAAVWSDNAHVILMIIGAMILCSSLLGFDGINSLSEETPDAGRVIPLATFLTARIGSVIFNIVSIVTHVY